MRVIVSPTTVPAGRVTFKIRNIGTVDHELVVLRDTGSKLVVKSYKAKESEALVIGEAEEIAPGRSTSLTLTLKSGKYILICNIPAHYQLGMVNHLIVK